MKAVDLEPLGGVDVPCYLAGLAQSDGPCKATYGEKESQKLYEDMLADVVASSGADVLMDSWGFCKALMLWIIFGVKNIQYSQVKKLATNPGGPVLQQASLPAFARHWLVAKVGLSGQRHFH